LHNRVVDADNAVFGTVLAVVLRVQLPPLLYDPVGIFFFLAQVYFENVTEILVLPNF